MTRGEARDQTVVHEPQTRGSFTAGEMLQGVASMIIQATAQVQPRNSARPAAARSR